MLDIRPCPQASPKSQDQDDGFDKELGMSPQNGEGVRFGFRALWTRASSTISVSGLSLLRCSLDS